MTLCPTLLDQSCQHLVRVPVPLANVGYPIINLLLDFLERVISHRAATA
ncbi:hypothetical protein [Coleofasciculus sp. FACHB-SPT36]|nr:hypothetical protein [Coleofasciculus sp. FACHB-SPT36]MBD2538657.1 hypothetical protein [Coleofasciculus sp. FACHB-SPT36]